MYYKVEVGIIGQGGCLWISIFYVIEIVLLKDGSKYVWKRLNKVLKGSSFTFTLGLDEPRRE